jgi:hypothetical protein
MKRVTALAVLVCVFSLTIANAELSVPCDCSRVIGDCGARVTLDGTTLVIQSSKPQCSRVTWYADDVQRSTTVIGGRAVEEWLGQSDDPVLAVEDCFVCVDTQVEINCVFPDSSKLVIPAGSAATQEEMVRASNSMKTFQAKANGYLECLERKFSVINSPEAKIEHNRRHNVAVDQMESVAGRFNAELEAYQEHTQ